MIIFIDIDETICETPENRDYTLSVPIEENIGKANELYDEGHHIVYWTARGSVSGRDLTELTNKQIKEWVQSVTRCALGSLITIFLLTIKI